MKILNFENFIKESAGQPFRYRSENKPINWGKDDPMTKNAEERKIRIIFRRELSNVKKILDMLIKYDLKYFTFSIDSCEVEYIGNNQIAVNDTKYTYTGKINELEHAFTIDDLFDHTDIEFDNDDMGYVYPTYIFSINGINNQTNYSEYLKNTIKQLSYKYENEYEDDGDYDRPTCFVDNVDDFIKDFQKVFEKEIRRY